MPLSTVRKVNFCIFHIIGKVILYHFSNSTQSKLYCISHLCAEYFYNILNKTCFYPFVLQAYFTIDNLIDTLNSTKTVNTLIACGNEKFI